MSTFVLDTHALVWYLDGDPRLSSTAERSIDSPDSTLVVPTIVLAETRYLFSRKRIGLSFEEISQAIENDDRCVVYPFDLDCVERIDDRLDLHDAVIVVTALVFRDFIDPSTKLISKDSAIQMAGVIETVW